MKECRIVRRPLLFEIGPHLVAEQGGHVGDLRRMTRLPSFGRIKREGEAGGQLSECGLQG